jgi:hypothetical protein
LRMGGCLMRCMAAFPDCEKSTECGALRSIPLLRQVNACRSGGASVRK